MTGRVPRSRCALPRSQTGADGELAGLPAATPGNHGSAGTVGNGRMVGTGPAWHRVVRYTHSGRVLDWVEVGQCARCGRGVDREFPREYVEVAGTDDRACGVGRDEPPGARGEDGPEIGMSPEGAAA